MIFIDSNIPMYLVGDAHPNKRRAQELLEELFDADERLVSDVEVLQEILNRYTAIGRREAIQPAFSLMFDIVDEFFPLGVGELERAKDLVLATELAARDSLHVVVMRQHGVERILSFDADFDKVSDITRIH